MTSAGGLLRDRGPDGNALYRTKPDPRKARPSASSVLPDPLEVAATPLENQRARETLRHFIAPERDRRRITEDAAIKGQRCAGNDCSLQKSDAAAWNGMNIRPCRRMCAGSQQQHRRPEFAVRPTRPVSRP